jgi:peptidoglycan/xylan/chitin deacetylase (PgdA/CDA1 family)
MRKAILSTLIIFVLILLFLPFRTARAEESVTPLPILMYHSVSKSKTGVYFVSPETLDRDLAELTKRGYEFVTLEKVKAYLRGKGDLPQKPLLLTFDDGHYDNLYYGLPLLKKHGATAVLNVIGCFTEYSSTHEKDKVEYSHLTWDEIAYLARSGVFEIGSHTYGMHAYKPRFGVKRKKSEPEDEHLAALNEDFEKIDRALLDKCSVRPVAFAYPFGAYDDVSEKAVTDRYDAVFTCYERINLLKKGDEKKLLKLWRINRDGTRQTAAFLDAHRIF